MFVKMPNVSLEEWPREIIELFRKTQPQYVSIIRPWEHFMYYDISGMTFSGHPFTTYYNTVSSLAYASFYLYITQKDNFPHFVWAAGDDLVIWH